MIRLIILAILFFTVIAISPLLIGDKGYILISMGNLTIESTVVTAVMMSVLIFILLFVLIKIIRSGFKLGHFSWHKIAFLGRRKAFREFNQGIAAYLLKDFAQSEKLMAKCAEASPQPKLAWLVAASAAGQQSDNKNGLSNSAHYLTLIDDYAGSDQSVNLETLLITVDLLMQQKAYHQARAAIDDNHTLIGHDARLLSLEINLCIVEKRFQTAADYLVSARKQKTITELTIATWESVIFKALFTEQITKFDQQHLYDYWHKLANKVKQSEAVFVSYCQVLAINKLNEPLSKLLLPKLKKDPSENFLKLIRPLPLLNIDEFIAVVQKHLQKQPDEGKWLSLLGHLACASKQWTMADKAFHSLVNLQEKTDDKQDLLAYANSQQQQGLYQQANELLIKITRPT